MSGANREQHFWEHESLLRRFEGEWHAGSPPRIDDFLPADASARTAVLMELACTDLEYRLKAGQAARVEEYRERYPQLDELPTAILDMIGVEFGVRRRSEPGLSLADYRNRFPQFADALQEQFDRITREVRTPVTPSPAVPERVPSIPGYEVLCELGRGGMGVVYKARQRGLKRFVALKMIRAGRDEDPEVISRFRAEAEAVARLQHPNIVQVYEVGEHEGRPYFSLEYVPGGSLADALAGSPQPDRPSAELVEILSRAIEAAHRAGIIHRDLKPANVLLGGSREWGVGNGENPSSALVTSPLPTPYSLLPKITDFGLAKQLEDGSGQTQTGSVLGTPSYMAPEQAAGRLRQIGPPTDVYALGAVLYECLTGRPPFKAATAWETVRQVINTEPVPPARMQPGVSRDLETICLKCLEKEPHRRYARAELLAADLARFVRGEPVHARPVSAVERLWRWARRNRRVAALLFALFSVLVIGLTAVTGLWLLAESRRETAEKAVEQIKRERDKTAAVRAKRMEALDDMTAQESLDWLTSQKHLLPRQEAFLKGVLQHYQEFAALKANDEESQKLIAEAALRVGNILQALGRYAEAEPAYRQAETAFKRLVGEHPDVANYAHGQANCFGHLARLLLFQGRRSDALTIHLRALAIREQLVQAHSDEPYYREKLIEGLRRLAEIHRASDERDQAVAAQERAVAESERLGKGNSNNATYRHEQSVSLSGLANLLTDVNRMEVAAATYQQALALSEPLVREQPRVSVYRQQLAICYQGLAFAQSRLGRKVEAEASYLRARTELERLHAEEPGVAGYRHELADNLCYTANLLADTNRRDEAVSALRGAVGIYEKLASEQPTILEYRQDWARSLSNLGNYLIDLNQRDEAAIHLQRSLTLRKRLIDEGANTTQNQEELGVTYYHLGKQALGNDARAALDWYGKAIETLIPVVQQNSQSQPARHFLSAASVRRAEMLNDLNRPGDALADWERALELGRPAPDLGIRLGRAWTQARLGNFPPAIAEADALAAVKNVPAAMLYQCARIYALAAAAATNTEQVERHALRAMEVLRQALAAGFKDMASLKTDPALNSLRHRADFQKLLADLDR